MSDDLNPVNPGAGFPEDFRYMVEAMHWAKCLMQAAELEEKGVQLSQVTDWIARAMAAAREDLRAELEAEGGA